MSDTPKLSDALPTADLLFDRVMLEQRIAHLAERIDADYANDRPLYLTVMNGGMLFASQLALHISTDLEFDYLHVTRYGQETSGGALSWRSAPWTSVKDRTVIVLDDILDEGVTLAAIVDRVTELGAKACYTAVATDKQNGKHKPLKADFVALSVEDRFLFGYGMDVRGLWRNLPAIYAMKEE